MLKKPISQFVDACKCIGQVNPKAYLNAFLCYAGAYLRLQKSPAYPICLDIVLTKACNLQCVFCISYTSLRDHRWMDFGLYEKIAEELFPKAVHLYFCSGGEPLLYPRIRDALNLAAKWKMHVSMVTNGMLLGEDVARWMVSGQGLHELWVSFDGAKKETLERIRKGADFHRILNNIKQLSLQKKNLGRKYPEIGFRFVIMRSNAEELPKLFEICCANGVARVQVVFLNVANEMDFDESLFNHQELAERVFQDARKKATEYGIELRLPLLPSKDKRKRRCMKPWEYLFIDSDGSLRVCTKSWRQRFGFYVEGFIRVWRSEHYRKIRQSMGSPEPYLPYCKYCSERFGSHNRTAHYLLQHEAAYTIRGLEHLQVDFNRRVQENRNAFQQSRIRRFR